MKRIVEVTDATGFEAALGESIILLCGSYFYTGKLVGVNADHLELADAKLVYETGPWDSKTWQDAQALPGTVWRGVRGGAAGVGGGFGLCGGEAPRLDKGEWLRCCHLQCLRRSGVD